VRHAHSKGKSPKRTPTAKVDFASLFNFQNLPCIAVDINLFFHHSENRLSTQSPLSRKDTSRRFLLAARNKAGTEPGAPVVSCGTFNNREAPKTTRASRGPRTRGTQACPAESVSEGGNPRTNYLVFEFRGTREATAKPLSPTSSSMTSTSNPRLSKLSAPPAARTTKLHSLA
jgi:hypothetical protein